MELRALSLTYDIHALRALLSAAGIRLEPGLDYCCGLYDGERLVAAGGYEGATIKCLAVDEAYQGEALMNVLVSHLYTRLRTEGVDDVFVFTKPENVPLFETLHFYTLAKTQHAALLESRKGGIEEYLRTIAQTNTHASSTGCIVMNANPFTLGHRYLVEQARAACETLYVFVVEEEKSLVPFAERFALVQAGTNDMPQVHVVPGGRYIISAQTFPSYFLKDPGGAAEVYAALDAAIFAERIAPALSISARYVGSEPADPLTHLYNETLARVLPAHNIALHVLARMEVGDVPVSASRVRALWKNGDFAGIKPLVPQTTYAYLKEHPYVG
ncbi:[citrate (pro-3S)-lyase] ligase [Christensenellaceae bacterium OttesenSCG-928-L17]|nr:[citrate (pro-3S)-lyase] ligase [Christensenellaceae bacterium OttesenSCG-928-L17]